jgi:hypothetical protein
MSLVYDTSCKPAFLLLLQSVNYVSAVVIYLRGTLVMSCFLYLSCKGRHIEFPTFIAYGQINKSCTCFVTSEVFFKKKYFCIQCSQISGRTLLFGTFPGFAHLTFW